MSEQETKDENYPRPLNWYRQLGPITETTLPYLYVWKQGEGMWRFLVEDVHTHDTRETGPVMATKTLALATHVQFARDMGMIEAGGPGEPEAAPVEVDVEADPLDDHGREIDAEREALTLAVADLRAAHRRAVMAITRLDEAHLYDVEVVEGDGPIAQAALDQIGVGILALSAQVGRFQ